MEAGPITRSVRSVPRLGFLGVGWIGQNRMKAILESGSGETCAVCEPSADMARKAQILAPGALMAGSLDALLDSRPDGIVIATPSAQHAEQAIRALEAGAAVFCQKPVGRNVGEAEMVVETARRNDLLLRTDLSYRHTKAMLAIRKYVQEGAIGAVFSADLVFHNAYGPDKPWFYDARLSGGGCVMDLGIHLVDLLLWTLGFPRVEAVTADLFTNGTRLSLPTDEVEDFAVAQLGLDDGATARLTCSWNLHAGQDAVISATFHGTEGALRFANVGGSFYDFTAELLKGTTREVLVEPPDEWGGRAAIQWAQRLAVSNKFDPEAKRLVAVSSVLDRIYGR